MRNRSEDLTQVVEWQDGRVRRVEDAVAGEEPLEIRIGRRSVAITMRTPGDDADLAAGLLLTEGILERPDQLASLDVPRRSNNLIRARLASGAKLDLARVRRNIAANSSCGVCGKVSIDAVYSRALHAPNPAFRFSADLLCALPDKARAAQTVFGRTGGLHAAALFDVSGELLVLREDIGRHNAVDKVIGWGLLAKRLPLAENVLLVSGRGGFEIIQKAAIAGIPAVACISAPSSLAVQLARRMRLTLVGFLRGRRFVIYSGEERLLSSEAFEVGAPLPASSDGKLENQHQGAANSAPTKTNR
jgi:FdhD protein